ncbi:RCC1 domain-containing protein [Dietzia maris]|uniref:RCC1 domain-containing protein n=1 Tax=Dietzia maris TaxID=37915 RepID=UPI0040377355
MGPLGAIGGIVGQAVGQPTSPPVAATSVYAIGSSSCALIEDGTVSCWGSNNEGQLGNGTVEDSSVPIKIPSLTGVSSISSSGFISCAVLYDGTVSCWGSNQLEQFGNAGFVATPVKIQGLSDVTSVEVLGTHACAVLRDRTVKCWGRNDSGQLGDGTFRDSLTPVEVTGLGEVKQVTGGLSHTCALLTDETARCWGHNYYGELGVGESVSKTPTPLEVANLSGIRSLSSSLHANCASLFDGTVSCWGTSYYSQLIDEHTAYAPTPTRVRHVSDVAAVSVGHEHYCALHADRTVSCWGTNSWGQLGNGTHANSSHRAAKVSGLSDVADVSASRAGAHSCALHIDGDVSCWGSNEYGQLGIGDMSRFHIPFPTKVAGLGGTILPPAEPTTPPAEEPRCKAAYFFAVPGSGEQNVSTENWAQKSRSLWNMRRGINLSFEGRSIDRADVETVIVNYPALPVDSMVPSGPLADGLSLSSFTGWLGRNVDKYLVGKNEGVVNLNAAISDVVSRCGSVPIMLGGYSQGAMVVHDWLNDSVAGFTKEEDANIVAVGLIADPERVAHSRVENWGSAKSDGEGVCAKFSSLVACVEGFVDDVSVPPGAEVRQVCDAEDIVCDTSKSVESLWENYQYITEPTGVLRYTPPLFRPITHWGVPLAASPTIADALKAQANVMVITHQLYGANRDVKNVGFSMGWKVPA